GGGGRGGGGGGAGGSEGWRRAGRPASAPAANPPGPLVTSHSRPSRDAGSRAPSSAKEIERTMSLTDVLPAAPALRDEPRPPRSRRLPSRDRPPPPTAQTPRT